MYVRGWPNDEQWTVVGGELWLGFPHYWLYNRDGATWRVAQLQVTHRPITHRKP